jgi:hypothetical protein
VRALVKVSQCDVLTHHNIRQTFVAVVDHIIRVVAPVVVPKIGCQMMKRNCEGVHTSRMSGCHLEQL